MFLTKDAKWNCVNFVEKKNNRKRQSEIEARAYKEVKGEQSEREGEHHERRLLMLPPVHFGPRGRRIDPEAAVIRPLIKCQSPKPPPSESHVFPSYSPSSFPLHSNRPSILVYILYTAESWSLLCRARFASPIVLPTIVVVVALPTPFSTSISSPFCVVSFHCGVL